MQSSLVPLAPPELTAQVAGRSLEAREVGGDFFNYFGNSFGRTPKKAN